MTEPLGGMMVGNYIKIMTSSWAREDKEGSTRNQVRIVKRVIKKRTDEMNVNFNMQEAREETPRVV